MAAGRSAACAPAPCRRRSASAWARPAPSRSARWARKRERLKSLRDRFYNKIRDKLPEVYLNGDLDSRIPGNLNLSFAYVEGEGLMMGIKDLAVSSGSACTSASLEPSYVLRALGVEEELAHTSLRIGHRALHDRTGCRLRGRAYRGVGPAPARDEPAVGDGAGRHRYQIDQVGGALIGAAEPDDRLGILGEHTWHIAKN